MRLFSLPLCLEQDLICLLHLSQAMVGSKYNRQRLKTPQTDITDFYANKEARLLCLGSGSGSGGLGWLSYLSKTSSCMSPFLFGHCFCPAVCDDFPLVPLRPVSHTRSQFGLAEWNEACTYSFGLPIPPSLFRLFVSPPSNLLPMSIIVSCLVSCSISEASLFCFCFR